MSFQDAVTTVLTKKYADFSGRARRSEYWFFSLAAFIAYVIAYAIGAAIGNQFLYYIVALALFVPGLAAGARRLHDTDKSGWLLLIGIIPILGAIVLLVFFVQDGTPGTNQYGPSPKGEAGFNQEPAGNWGQS